MIIIPLSERLSGSVLPPGIQLCRLWEHRSRLKFASHVADTYSHLGFLDDCVCHLFGKQSFQEVIKDFTGI